MTIDDKERALFRTHAAAIEMDAKALIAGCKTKEGVEKAAAWRVEQRNYMESVDASPIAKLKEYYREKWSDINEEYKGYVEPCKLWMKKVKDAMDAWYLHETERVKLASAKANAKIIAKAEEKQQQKVQVLMDLGKPKQAMAAAQRPLVVAAPPTIAMPKIKHAVWKKKYVVQIDDLGALLKYIGKNQKYHRMIDRETLVSRLESIAVDLDGNMKEFDGVRCFETATSAAIGGPQ
jgi:hypothetical protein